jgi:hypothetical protein
VPKQQTILQKLVASKELMFMPLLIITVPYTNVIYD